MSTVPGPPWHELQGSRSTSIVHSSSSSVNKTQTVSSRPYCVWTEHSRASNHNYNEHLWKIPTPLTLFWSFTLAGHLTAFVRVLCTLFIGPDCLCKLFHWLYSLLSRGLRTRNFLKFKIPHCWWCDKRAMERESNKITCHCCLFGWAHWPSRHWRRMMGSNAWRVRNIRVILCRFYVTLVPE